MLKEYSMLSDLDEAFEDLRVEVFLLDFLMRSGIGDNEPELLELARKRTASFISEHTKSLQFEIEQLRMNISGNETLTVA